MVKSSFFLVAAGHVIFLVNLRSCSNLPKYGLPNNAATAGYTPTPVYRDTATTAYYGGLGIHRTERGGGWQMGETAESTTAEMSIAYSSKWLSHGARGFGFYGNYYVREIPEYRGWKSYSGFGLSFHSAFCINIRKFNWRIVGLEYGFGKEYGKFRQFRELADRDSLINNTSKEPLFGHLNLSSELIFTNRKISFGLKIRAGVFGEYGYLSRGFMVGRDPWLFYLQSYHEESFIRTNLWQSGLIFRLK